MILMLTCNITDMFQSQHLLLSDWRRWMLFNIFVCHKDLQSQGLQTALYYLILQNLFNIDHMSQFGEEMHELFF